MKKNWTQKGKVSVILLFCFLLAGCSLGSVKDKLKNLDAKIGEGFNKLQNRQADQAVHVLDAKSFDIKNLTNAEKQKIEEWLAENNLNRYGDATGTIYTGGTPLFDESTGKALDRYEYIFKNHPELKDFLQNN